MLAARRLLAQRYLIALICAAALVLKLLVPTGYMIGESQGRITVTICSGTTPGVTTMFMPGDQSPEDHGKPEMPCAFSGLSAAALGAIDPVQLVALIAFVMATGVVGLTLPRLIRPTFLRPRLRAPPATF